MTAYLDIRVAVSDDELTNFLARLASSAIGVKATDEDGEVLATDQGGDVDKNGIPWLETVHAGTKTKTQDGRWKRLKGVSEEQRDAAEAAWKQANGAAAATTPVVPSGPAAVQAVFMPQTAQAPATPAVNPAPASVTIPPQVPGLPVAAPTAPVQAAPAMAIPGMTPPAPAPVPVVEDVPVSLDDVGTAFGGLTAKYGDLSQEFIDQIYTAAQVADPNMIVNDESARRRVVDVIARTIAQNQ